MPGKHVALGLGRLLARLLIICHVGGANAPAWQPPTNASSLAFFPRKMIPPSCPLRRRAGPGKALRL